VNSLLGENTSSTLELNLNLVLFIPQEDSFYPWQKVFGVKRSKFNFISRVEHFPKSADVVSKVSIFVYRIHRDWCDILSRSTIDVVLS